jgi:hypothetical protein
VLVLNIRDRYRISFKRLVYLLGSHRSLYEVRAKYRMLDESVRKQQLAGARLQRERIDIHTMSAL